LQEASMRAAAAEHELEQIRHEAEIAASEVATLREIADMQSTTAQEREALEEMLRVTQENLNGSNDRATEIQTRADAAEMALAAAREEVEELESRLRQIEMSQAVKQFVREDTVPAAELFGETPVVIGDAAALEDRRASTPFMQELSLDAKKSLTSILGLSLTLKHKSGPKEQAPLLRQLAAYARRLDHTVADLLDADKLARGEVDLHMRRTDLEALVQRVVEESQVGNDHDVRLQTERIIASVDPVRTEQILMGLLRGSTDRTPLGSAITIRLTKGEGGALISVEDAEASSDASLSPVVARFADIQGGWAKVESRPNGGSAFRVFLPAEGIMPDSPAGDADPEIELSVSPQRTDLEIVVSDELDKERQLVAAAADDDDPWAAGRLLVEELQKLSRDD
jgi:K+-sensing histidine kinase KdpD